MPGKGFGQEWMRKVNLVLEAIEREAPRDHQGELEQPFLGWARRMRADLERAAKWLDATEGKRVG